jgi:hypothetical protein
MREWEEKTRNALKYLVRWEVVNITQPKKNISNEDRLPTKFSVIASVEPNVVWIPERRWTDR